MIEVMNKLYNKLRINLRSWSYLSIFWSVTISKNGVDNLCKKGFCENVSQFSYECCKGNFYLEMFISMRLVLLTA